MIHPPQGSVSLWRKLAAVAFLSSGSRSCRSSVGSRSHLASNLWVACFASTSASSSSARDNTMKNDDPNDKTCRVDTSLSPHLVLHHFDSHQPIQSTQDEARRLLHEQKPSPTQGPFLATIADRQTNGRGTQGRKWEGGSQVGNLYLTVCIPYDKLPVMPTLLPLQIAVLVAERATQALEECRTTGDNNNGSNPADDNHKAKVTVKWPNDVLINQQKLAGTLIESEIVDGTVWLMIGIGTNIQFAPSLEQSPGKHVRGATSIQEHCFSKDDDDDATGEEEHNGEASLAYKFGADLAVRLVDWVMGHGHTLEHGNDNKASQEQHVIEQWRSYAEFGRTYELRGNVVDEDAGLHQGEEVVLIDIQQDGQLLVRGQNGRERLLVADYMF